MTLIKPIILAALLFITLNRAGAVTKITSLPFTITASGIYELTGNLTANGTNGIDVQASNVVINLGGFFIIGVTRLSGSAMTHPAMWSSTMVLFPGFLSA
jgi:hypothetical protein